jgi:orotidine-5'-phosphate decarboxylase
MTNFADQLADAVRSKNSCLVVGLDPRVGQLPEVLSGSDAERILEFNRNIIEATAPYACAVKPQIAFYEKLGPAGFEAFAETCKAARAAGLLVIGDIKRGDIGSTAAAYADAFMGADAPFPCDCVTVNPYLGTDSMTPWLESGKRTGAGLFVLVKTSNPSSSELQNLAVSGEAPLHHSVAALVNTWGTDLIGDSGYSSVGAVIGATHPDEAATLRGLIPNAWVLVPGYGAQGGTAEGVRPNFNPDGLGAVVNSSRGIIFAYENRADLAPEQWLDAIEDAAKASRDDLESVRG